MVKLQYIWLMSPGLGVHHGALKLVFDVSKSLPWKVLLGNNFNEQFYFNKRKLKIPRKTLPPETENQSAAVKYRYQSFTGSPYEEDLKTNSSTLEYQEKIPDPTTLTLFIVTTNQPEQQLTSLTDWQNKQISQLDLSYRICKTITPSPTFLQTPKMRHRTVPVVKLFTERKSSKDTPFEKFPPTHWELGGKILRYQ
ncbi:hypothetical protein L873DRAFT_1791290 [Choiromyces venosus 120613-1]|uniref:Uncharacterized protein n=1 Tax=Choiromyces venosus 120613-1 TaxID=1336337 RepID=A0A3N4JFG7_9PEZI|nr:hypothetical protein L873DRAFT_1791290 [Choiromyces venosus 120613-1]